MTNSPFVVLRDTISKQTDEYTPESAQQWLDHPVFGLRLEVVNTNKPEVLSAPFIFDAEGEKHLIEDYAEVDPEVAEPVDLVIDYSTFHKVDLIAEAEARNTHKPEDAQIDVKANKDELVAALEADDNAKVAAIIKDAS